MPCQIYTILLVLLSSGVMSAMATSQAPLQYTAESSLTIFEGSSVDVLISGGSDGEVEGIGCRLTYRHLATLAELQSNATHLLIRLRGTRLGREYVECVGSDGSGTEVAQAQIPLVIVRRHNFVDDAFGWILTAMAILLNVVFGTDVNISVLKFIVKRPVKLIAAGMCQFVLLPPVGLAIARAFAYEPDMGLGLLMVACAPGGGQSNTATFLVDGELPLSITMTFFSATLALGMMPWNMWVYSRFLSDDPNYTPGDLPFLRMVLTLASIVFPVSLGMLLASKAPAFTQQAMKFFKPFVLICLAIVVAIVIYKGRYTFALMTWDIILGAFILPATGMTMGVIASLIIRVRFSQLKTIAFEIGFQNVVIVMGMGQVAFEQPEADLNLVAPFTISLMTACISVPLYALHYIVRYSSTRYATLCEENRAALEKEKRAYSNQTDDETMQTDVEHGKSATVTQF